MSRTPQAGDRRLEAGGGPGLSPVPESGARSPQPGTLAARDSVGSMKVTVDLTICDLHGLCVETAPEVFEIADDGALKVLNATPPDTLRDRVEKAARECPTGAITVEG